MVGLTGKVRKRSGIDGKEEQREFDFGRRSSLKTS
jgi:hypothetical protein